MADVQYAVKFRVNRPLVFLAWALDNAASWVMKKAVRVEAPPRESRMTR